MTPDEIRQKFMERWGGTEEELSEALELFYNDIRDSFDLVIAEVFPSSTLSGSKAAVLDTVDSYITNHYGD